MRSTVLRLSVAAMTAMCAQAVSAAETFTGSQSFTSTYNHFPLNAVYTVTTDGTNGALNASDILSWTVTLSGLGLSDTFGSASGGSLSYTGGLSEAGGKLLYDFGTNGSNNSDAYAFFHNAAGDWLCFQANGCYDSNGGGIHMTYTDGGTDPERGLQVIASAVGSVPEPATWGMMLIGFGGLGVAVRRRRALAPQLS